ncbi:MAG: hypothetical protein IJ004_05075 [Clostridia bacterium]|nr:hypothetical protein [Clostridia bacterium]
MSKENDTEKIKFDFDQDENQPKNPLIRFIKNNSKEIFTLIRNHIAIAVFGLIVVVACDMLAASIWGIDTAPVWPNHVGGGVAILLYLGLMYVVMWEKGAKDRTKLESGRLVRDNLYGLKVWLCANSLIILLTVLMLIFKPFWSDGSGVLDLILRFLNGMYISIMGSTPLGDWGHLIALVPGPVVAILSYISGISGQKCLFPENKNDRNRNIR